MNTSFSAKRQPMPELQLQEAGTESSYDTLFKASQTLTDAELSLLEEDLSYYLRTGLVGIHMSRLLVLLQLDALEKTVKEKCFASAAKETDASQRNEKCQVAA